jgi:beta-xylosidase
VSGDEWFLHFQDRGLYGRILHMQPVTWKDGWPVIGEDPDGDGCGDPVFAFKKPAAAEDEPSYLEASDDFAGHKIGLMWQWLGNCRSSDTRIVSAAEGEDGIRLHAVNLSGEEKPILWHSANVLTEKLVLPEFTCDIVMKPAGLKPGNKAGAAMMGGQYVSLCAERDAGGLSIVLSESEGGDADKTEKVLFRERIASSENETPEKLTFRLIYERESGDKSDLFFANVDAEKPVLRMLWSADGEHFCDSTCRFVPVDHTWVGAKIGIFALSDQGAETGYADFLSVRVTELM